MLKRVALLPFLVGYPGTFRYFAYAASNSQELRPFFSAESVTSRYRLVSGKDATKRVPTERSGRAKDFGELSRAVHLGPVAAAGSASQNLSKLLRGLFAVS